MSARKPVAHAIETIQIEERRYKPSPEYTKQANAQPEIYERGFDEFWSEEANNRISWFQPWNTRFTSGSRPTLGGTSAAG
jgi:hypothetical protein